MINDYLFFTKNIVAKNLKKSHTEKVSLIYGKLIVPSVSQSYIFSLLLPKKALLSLIFRKKGIIQRRIAAILKRLKHHQPAEALHPPKIYNNSTKSPQKVYILKTQ
jgi:hypothetical protein